MSSAQQEWQEGCTEVVDGGRKEWEVHFWAHLLDWDVIARPGYDF